MDRERTMRRTSFAARVFRAIIAIMALGILVGGGELASAHTDGAGNPLPHATVKIWPIASPIGFNPDPSVEDVTGVTGHVATAANPLTVVTAIENTTHPGGPCGVIFWNPVTNLFKWYGYGFGFQLGVDVNKSAPVKTSGTKTFGPGDTWLANTGCPTLLVNFAGSDNFRSYGTSSAKGVQVDQATGNVWYTEVFAGNIGLLDPATSMAKVYAVGGTPHFIAVDSTGRGYVPVGCVPVAGVAVDQIVRVDPGTNEVRRWAIPGGGLRCGIPSFETSDGIATDADGRVWFVETASNQIGRLNPATNEICEFTKSGLSNPQMIASSGSGGTLQSFFTEGEDFSVFPSIPGNAVSVLTQVEAVGTCVTVTPTIATLVPSTPTLAVTDFTEQTGLTGCPCLSCQSPLTATITPTVHDIPGVNGGPDALGTTKTAGPDGIAGNADDERIPGILRFPFPSAAPPTAVTFPSGMTRVALPNTVFGSDLFNNHVFQITSGAIIAPPPSAKCPLTLGFWKNHPDAWPVTSLTLGSQSYTQAELLAILKTSTIRDASLVLARQLITAKLNIANGSAPTPISATITSADSLLSGFGGKLPYNVKPSSATGQAMVNDANTLDSYNNGQLTPNCTP